MNWCVHFCTTTVILSYDDRRIFLHLTTQSTLHQNTGYVTSGLQWENFGLDHEDNFLAQILMTEVMSNGFLMKNQRHRFLQGDPPPKKKKPGKKFRGIVP